MANTKELHRYPLGIVGNCSYIAYIDNWASVQWLCMPRFDSRFVFGSLLDPDKGGEFSIRSSLVLKLHCYTYLFHWIGSRAAFKIADALADAALKEKAAVEALLERANHLGLFSEDVDLHGGQWGNFLQTYSHMGLMNAVYRIARRLDQPIFF